DESVPLLGEQVDNSVKLAKLAKRAESPEITQARQVMESAVKHFFDKTAAALAAHVRGQHEKLAKAAGPADLPPIQWDALVPDLFGSLNTIARTQAGRAVAELKVDDSKMLSDVNTVASDWANERAAELVGMRRTASGRLIQNPKAEWTISTKTRDDLRGIVTEAFEKKTAMSDLADQIQNAGVFSDYRAHLIAATETNRAANQGNLAGWRVSGQVEQLEWTLSADHDDKDGCDCGENADGSPYPIDDCPELPAHPGCQCALVVAQLVGQEPD
ncbi:MAG TPA: phage minor head protein, partial [Candidatus Acidoferrales bacterium]|nr:phage minor head protein [Candidatus Acidoferrales bacterium]